MTTAQRNKHIAAIEDVLKEYGYTLNRYNKWQNGDVRIDTRKVNMIVQCGETKLFSQAMTSLTMDVVRCRVDYWTNMFATYGKQKLAEIRHKRTAAILNTIDVEEDKFND